MFSIRNNRIVLSAVASAAALTGFGCSSVHVTTVVKTPEPVAAQPVADEATELRAFQVSEAKYHSGATLGWPTRYYYAPNPDYSTPVDFVVDPLMFFVQGASLPETMRIEPPFKHPTIYAGDVMPPSYTAMPPLPPTLAESQAVPDPDPLSAPRPAVIPPLPPIPEEQPPLILPKPPAAPAKGNAAKPLASPATQPARSDDRF